MYAPWLLLILFALIGCQGSDSKTADASPRHPVDSQQVDTLRAASPSDTPAITPAESVLTKVYVDTVKSGDSLIIYQRWIARLDSMWEWRKSTLLGVPFGFFAQFASNTSFKPNTQYSNMGYGVDYAGGIVQRIDWLRQNKLTMVAVPTGGARCNYLTPPCVNGKPVSGSKFDINKWRAKLNTFNTPTIRQAIQQAYADNIISAVTLIDEPNNVGNPGNEGNTWGPTGTFTAAILDTLCADAKKIFVGVPIGHFLDFQTFKSGQYFAGQKLSVCDFITSQWAARKGAAVPYRDAAMAEWKRQGGLAPSFGMNILDGGFQSHRGDRSKPWECPLKTADGLRDSTGGLGTYKPNCRMTAQQVKEVGAVLGAAACFLTGFRYDATFMAKPENIAALNHVASVLKVIPRRSCHRSL